MKNLEHLINLLRKRIPTLQAVYHFGSTARGEARDDSDVDVAFLSSELLRAGTLYELQGMCMEVTGGDVHLVELRKADPVFAMEVMGCGEAVFVCDADAVAEFETAAMSMYCAFNEETRDLVSAIAERGSVYAR